MAKKNKPDAFPKRKEPAAPEPRKFPWKGVAATGAALTAAGAMVFTSMPTAHYSPPSKDTTSLTPESPSFLTINETVAIYQNLEKQMVEKKKQADAKGKPLRIFVLERHGSKNALAYEMMLADIASKLGIRTMALEASEEMHKEALTRPMDWGNDYILALRQQIIQTGLKRGMTPQPIDNFYKTIPDWNAAWDGYTEEIAQPQIRQYLHQPGVSVKVTSDPDPASYEFSHRIEGLSHPLDKAQEKEVGKILWRARNVASDVIREKRNAYMIEKLGKIGSAMVVVGNNHGQGMLTPLREAGDVDLTFSIWQASDKNAGGEKTGNIYADSLLAWSHNPNNAVVVCEGKDFPPENLPIFVERAIERANIEGARGR